MSLLWFLSLGKQAKQQERIQPARPIRRRSRKSFRRRIQVEWLERRDLLSVEPSLLPSSWGDDSPWGGGLDSAEGESGVEVAPAVQYRLDLLDTNNQPLPTDVNGNPVVPLGEAFRLVGYHQDITYDQGEFVGEGVFAGYIDVFYTNADRILVRHGETQQLEFYPNDPLVGISGQFTLTFDGQTTAPITYTTQLLVLGYHIQLALEALPNIGSGNVRVSQAPSPQDPPPGVLPNAFRVQFMNELGEQDVPMLEIGSSGLNNLSESPGAVAVELFPADLAHPGTFRSAFTGIDPYIHGLNAVNKEELEPGQPDGGRSLGGVGSFLDGFSSSDPSAEHPFFSVDLIAVAPGQVRFSANPPDYQEAAYEGTDTLVFPTTPLDPKFVVAPENIHFLQTINDPLVLVVTSDLIVVDDSQAGFSRVGTWTDADGGYLGGKHYAAAGTGDHIARWTVPVTPGQYRVSTHWQHSANRATDAPFTFRTGDQASGITTPLTTVRINQATAPSSFSANGVMWQDLANPFVINDDLLEIELCNAAGGFVIADAIRVERIGDLPPHMQIIDDTNDPQPGDVDFRIVGGIWTPTVGGFDNDKFYAEPGSGATARWSFVVEPGQYEVAASWQHSSNRATDAPFTIRTGTLRGGTVPVTTVRINQQTAPSDFSAAGANWRYLASPVVVTGSILEVDLSNDADGFVIADVIYIRRIADLPGNVQIVDDGDTDFALHSGVWVAGPDGFQSGNHSASAGIGASQASWTFVVEPARYRISATWNPQTGAATNAQFTVFAGATVDTLAPLVTIQADQSLAPDDLGAEGAAWEDLATALMVPASILRIQLSDDANGTVIADAIRIERIANLPPEIQVIDNGDAGYVEVGSWVTTTDTNPNTTIGGFKKDKAYSQSGNGSNTATWRFIVTPGYYRVAVTWEKSTNRATDAPYTISTGTTATGSQAIETLLVNQQLEPSGFFNSAVNWQVLNPFVKVEGDLLEVVLSNAASPNGSNPSFVIADGVRIERVGDLPLPLQYIDNGDDVGFEFTVGADQWIHTTLGFPDGFQGDKHYANQASLVGPAIAQWSALVEPGVYRVSTTWLRSTNRATNAPYTILTGTTLAGTTEAITVQVNQQNQPDSFQALSRGWFDLHTSLQVLGDLIQVRLSNDANGFVIADAIRLERIGDLP